MQHPNGAVFSPLMKLRLFQFKSVINDQFTIEGGGVLALYIGVGGEVEDMSIISQSAVSSLIGREIRFESFEKNIDIGVV